jgi:flagellin
MSVSIRHNAASFANANNLGRTQGQLSRTLDRVASGNRITVAADDAAGSAVSLKLSTAANSTKQAIRNARDGQAIIHTVEAALNEALDISDRLRELSVQSATEVLHEDEREHISTEFASLRNEFERIAETLEFNDQDLGGGQTIEVQVGVEASSNSRIELQLSDLRSHHTGLAILDVSTTIGSQAAITRVDQLISRLNGDRARMGALHNRLDSAISNAESSHLSLSAAASRIQDSDMAHESAQMTALQVKQQAGTAAMSQANQLPSSVVNLI